MFLYKLWVNALHSKVGFERILKQITHMGYILR